MHCLGIELEELYGLESRRFVEMLESVDSQFEDLAGAMGIDRTSRTAFGGLNLGVS